MARGNASKVFHPFLLPADLNGNSEDLRNKLLVNFDPMRCFVGDIEASICNALILTMMPLRSISFWANAFFAYIFFS